MKKRRMLALGLSVLLAFGGGVPMAEAAPKEAEEAAMTTLPGTTKVEKDYDETFLSVTGFAKDMVQDRSHYYEEYVKNGYQNTENYVVVDADYYQNKSGKKLSVSDYESLKEEEKAEYTLVTSEEQFCKAMTHARVVEIREDLELGFKYLEKNGINTYGTVGAVSNYGKGYEPISSPVLIEVGVSDIYVNSHMTIFSPNGSKIEHACFSLNKVEDVVIRNIAIEGNYEWDDVPKGTNSTPGNSTRYGWSNVSCNNSKGVWLDHCDFGYTFDGNIDLKNDSQVSITWCRFGVQDISKDSDLYKNIQYMEEKYQAGEGFIIYTILRDNGATMEQIFNLACEHHSVHLVGSGEDDYETNPLNAITMAYTQYIDCDNRMPKIRQGNGHLFNCYFDSQSYLENCYGDETFVKAREAVKKAGYSIKGICRGMDPCLGASIGADTCIWDGFLHPTIGDEINVEGKSGRFVGAVNYQLIVNSSLRSWDSDTFYTGSSWDKEGNNPLAGMFTKTSSDSYITRRHFQWSQWKPMTKVKSEAVDGVCYVPENLVDNLAPGEFYKQYYLGRETLGYDYQTVPLEKVKEVTDLYSGAGKVSFEDAGEWTKLQYGLKDNQCVVVLDGEEGKFQQSKAFVCEKNTAIGELPVSEKKGYEFLGWYEGTYEEKDGRIQLVLKDIPVKEDQVITGNMYLYGKWKIRQYTVSFESFGGSEAAPITGIDYGIPINKAGELPEKLTREGFTFMGWYQYSPETGFGSKILGSTLVTDNMTLYAKWKPEKVKVLFDTKGGSQAAPVENAEYNKTILLPEVPEKEGYEFAGWFYDEDLTKEFKENTKVQEKLSADISISATLTLYAKWVEKEAEITGKMGDVNGDSIVDANDALLILKYVAKMDVQIDSDHLKLADVNGKDGKLDANDALIILKYVAKMIPGFE